MTRVRSPCIKRSMCRLYPSRPPYRKNVPVFLLGAPVVNKKYTRKKKVAPVRMLFSGKKAPVKKVPVMEAPVRKAPVMKAPALVRVPRLSEQQKEEE